MKLYDNTHAPNPRRVRIFMAEKGVSCENQQVDIVAGENLMDDFLAVNPRGMLPTLVLDDGSVLDETIAICRYIEESNPGNPLMGTDAASKAHIEARQRHMEWDGLIPAMDAFRNAFPGFSERGLGGNVGTVNAIPDLAARGKAMLARFYANLDAHLADNQFVAGDSFSVADITALCTIDFASTAARTPVPEECTNVARWHAEVSSRDSAKA